MKTEVFISFLSDVSQIPRECHKMDTQKKSTKVERQLSLSPLCRV